MIKATFTYFRHFLLREPLKRNDLISDSSTSSHGLHTGTSTIRPLLRLEPQAHDICLCSEAVGYETFTQHFTKHHAGE